MSPPRARSGGTADRDDVDAVEEVLAEALLLDLGLEVAVGRGDDARVERHLLVAADRAHRALLQHAQQLRPASPSGISPISSRKSVPPAGLHEQAGARPLGVGERAA